MRFVTETHFQAAQKLHKPTQLPWRAYARWLLCNAPSTLAAHADRELLLRALTPRQALTAVLHCAQNLSGLTQCFALYGASVADMDAVLTSFPKVQSWPCRATHFVDTMEAADVLRTIPVAHRFFGGAAFARRVFGGAAWLRWLSNRLPNYAPLAFMRTLEDTLPKDMSPEFMRQCRPYIQCWLADIGRASPKPWPSAIFSVMLARDKPFYDALKASAMRKGETELFERRVKTCLLLDNSMLRWALAEGVIRADEEACVLFVRPKAGSFAPINVDALRDAGADAQLLEEMVYLAKFNNVLGPNRHALHSMDELLAQMLKMTRSLGCEGRATFERLWEDAPESLRAKIDKHLY